MACRKQNKAHLILFNQQASPICLSRACLGKTHRFGIETVQEKADRSAPCGAPEGRGPARGRKDTSARSQCLRKPQPFSQLSLYLSRACLGKMFVFSMEWRTERRVFAPVASRTRIIHGSSGATPPAAPPPAVVPVISRSSEPTLHYIACKTTHFEISIWYCLKFLFPFLFLFFSFLFSLYYIK